MTEPCIEWGRELKAKTESLSHMLKECNEAVRETMIGLGEIRQFKNQVTSQLNRVEQKISDFTQLQVSTKPELTWMKWILGVGATGLIAVGIFVVSTLIQLSSTTAKLEATLQHMQIQLKR